MTVFLARNNRLDVPPPPFLEMCGSQDLGLRADPRVEALIIRNLTANQPIDGYNYTFVGHVAPSLSLKIRFLGSHIMRNKIEYAKTVAWTVAFVAVCVGTVVAVKFTIAYLAALKADILLGKLIVGRTGTVVVEVWKYYYINLVGLSSGIAELCLFDVLFGAASCLSILNIKNDFVRFLEKHPLQSFSRQTFQFTAKNLSHIQNNRKKDQSYEDCISLEPIPENWIHAPRFIQIGTMIYPLNSILKHLMNAAWINDGLKHPHESRKFTVPEQTDLMNNLANLFAMDRSEITQCLVQHRWDLRRSEFLKKLPAAVLDHQILLNNAGDEGSSFTLRECLQT